MPFQYKDGAIPYRLAHPSQEPRVHIGTGSATAAAFPAFAARITPGSPPPLLALDSRWGRGLLALVWCLELRGTSLKIFWMGAPRWLSVALYLGMGWAAVLRYVAPIA